MKYLLDKAKDSQISTSLENLPNEIPYNNSTTYSVGDIVEYNGYVYSSVADDNNETPNDLTKWVYWDSLKNRPYPVKFPDNKNRLYDDYSITYSSGSDVTIEYKNELNDYIGFWGMECEKIKVTLYDENDVVIFSQEKNMITDDIWDTWDFLYWSNTDKLTFWQLNLPIYFGGKIVVEITGDNIKIGTIELGETRFLGCTYVEASYSYTGTDKAVLDSSTGIPFYTLRNFGGNAKVSAKINIDNNEKMNSVVDFFEKKRDDILTLLVDDRDMENVPIRVFHVRGKLTNFSTPLRTSGLEYNIDIESI